MPLVPQNQNTRYLIYTQNYAIITHMPTITIIILAGVGLVLILAAGIFNSLISKRNRVKNAWSDIDVQLKRRYDLVPNLVEVVKGYRDHEASTLERVTQARSGALNYQNKGAESRGQAEEMLTVTLKSLFAVVENYPQLMASQNFRTLQEQLVTIEDNIQAARRYYNAAVRELNIAVQVFPANILAAIFGFKKEEFFGAKESEKEAVPIKF